MSTIVLDGVNEEAFRRSIESRLRQGLDRDAVERLRALLAPFAGPDKILPERFLTVHSAELILNGWDRLAEAVARHDREGWPITALSIAFGWPGEEVPVPDADGRLSPLIETAFFTDEAYPFSRSAREDLLEGYSYHGCTWSDESVATETCLRLDGIDDLHGALALLEARLLASEEPDEEEIRAGSLGACLLSALLFQAVAAQIERAGLPRPLCVLSGSNGVYPYFDAPVAGMPAELLGADEEDEPALSQVPGPRYSSLLVTGIPRARKRAVLVLEESDEDKALRTADLRNLAHREEGAPAAPIAPLSAAEPQTPGEGGIIPRADGPLLAKKEPHKAWDFRDMLSPRDAPADQPSLPPEDLGDAHAAVPELPQGLAEPLPTEPDMPPQSLPERMASLSGASFPRIPRLPRTPPPEPGFSLLDETVAERLEKLVAPEPAPEAPAETPREAATEPAPAGFAAPIDTPAWPLGIGWLEDIAADPGQLDTTPVEEEPKGLLARLRRWISRR
ncbi:MULTISPECIES: hypothetical protein [unclassified Novosphingobium]|uniref:hypothetical protein n=1 Tax=unclassified Novosphingobium TaxID=2644732 RepID=UPI0025FF00A4|nr:MULTISPECIES: hypothetical protein [unclassified Novosphingobium]HQV02384.1 hypothetical protein [Novosphingobium sp.]